MGASSDEPTDQHSGSAASSEANYRSDLLANRTSHPEFPFCLSVSADYTPNSLWLCLGFFFRPEPSEGTKGQSGLLRVRKQPQAPHCKRFLDTSPSHLIFFTAGP